MFHSQKKNQQHHSVTANIAELFLRFCKSTSGDVDIVPDLFVAVPFPATPTPLLPARSIPASDPNHLEVVLVVRDTEDGVPFVISGVVANVDVEHGVVELVAAVPRVDLLQTWVFKLIVPNVIVELIAPTSSVNLQTKCPGSKKTWYENN